MTPDLELALRELDVEWPATPDIAAAVGARIAAESAPRAARGSTSRRSGAAGWRRRHREPGAAGWLGRRRGAGAPQLAAPRGWRARAAYALAALALLFGGAMAVSPEARTSVLRWLGLKSVEIKREPPRRPPPGAALNLGRPSTVAALRAEGVPVLVPKALTGSPGVYETSLPDGTLAASLVYDSPPVLVQAFSARVRPFIEKTVASADAVDRLTVDGAPAYWITGAHGFAYTAPDGNTAFEEQRIADSVLLVERDGTLLRVEGHIPRERAVAIAQSVQ